MKSSQHTKRRVAVIPVLLLAWFSVLVSTQAQPCIPAPPGLVAWWPGDGNAQEITGGSNGTLRSGTTFASGINGQAFKLNGCMDFVDVGTVPAASFASASFTASAWVFLTGSGWVYSDEGIVSRWVEPTGGSWVLGRHREGRFWFGIDSNGTWPTERNAYASDIATTNQWHYVAATYDHSSGTLRIYVDGVLSGTDSGPPIAMYEVAGQAMQIGYGVDCAVQGLVDEVAVFSRALASNEIAAIYAAGSAGMCKTPCVPAPVGLVAWWPGDGNAKDIQGTNNATLMSGATFAMGEVGQGFSFDGVDDYLALPGSPALDFGTNDFTIELWANFSALDHDQTLFHKSVGTYPNTRSYLLEWSPAEAVGTNVLRFAVADTAANANDLFALAQLQTGLWYHIAGVRAGNTSRLFLNGALIKEQSAGNNMNSGFGGSVTIGALNALGRYFFGKLDEVGLYNRALSAAEIQVIYNSGGAGKCSHGQPPSISSHPASQIVSFGANLTLSVAANGASPLFYQWRRNGINLLDGTNFFGVNMPSLVISNLQLAQLGAYSVVVSNALGRTNSGSAILGLADTQDDDHDGIPNWWEVTFEMVLKNPLDVITNVPGERLNYLQKYLNHLDPTSLDTDGDGLSDYDELFLYATDPAKLDTDDDGMPDGWEIAHGLNPRSNDANDDLDGDGLSNLAEYQWSIAHPSQPLDPTRQFSDGTRQDFQLVNGGTRNTRFTYDKIDRLVGAEYANGLAIGYGYDGNGNLVRQTHLKQDTNTLSILWRFLTGLTNSTKAGAYDDADGDGWSNYQEWKAGSDPLQASSRPDLFNLPGTNIVSLTLPFTPSNFVAGVGQLDGYGAEDIVIGADGNPGTSNNFLLVLTQTSSSWSTQRVDIGTVGVTSLAVGQLTNRPGPAIYAGLRGTTNGSGRIVELINVAGLWQTTVVATSTNEAAFVLGVRGQDVLVSLATMNAADGALYAARFATNWTTLLMDTNTSHRGLGTLYQPQPQTNSAAALRLLDSGGIAFGAAPKSDQFSVLASNLISYWKLDESSGNAFDSVGFNTLANSNGVTYVSSKINNGANLGNDSTPRALTISSALGLGANGAKSFSCWVKLNAEISSSQWYFVQQNNTLPHCNCLLAYDYNGGTRRLFISKYDGSQSV